jgi:hypothetical protein
MPRRYHRHRHHRNRNRLRRRVLTVTPSVATSLASIRAAERRLERSIVRVQAGRPLWDSSSVRLGVEAALGRKRDALAEFKRSFDEGVCVSACVRLCVCVCVCVSVSSPR